MFFASIRTITTAVILAVVFLYAGCSPSSSGNAEGTNPVFAKAEAELRDLSAKPVGDHFDSKKTTVFIILSPECPLCVSYVPVMNAINDSIEKCGMQFYGVFPGSYYSAADVAQYRKEYGVNFDCVMDPKMNFCRHIGATVTPEAYVVNAKEGRVLYHGRIDDWMYEVGKKRLQPTRHDLRQALYEISSGKTVSVPETKALGCFIENE